MLFEKMIEFSNKSKSKHLNDAKVHISPNNNFLYSCVFNISTVYDRRTRRRIFLAFHRVFFLRFIDFFKPYRIRFLPVIILSLDFVGTESRPSALQNQGWKNRNKTDLDSVPPAFILSGCERLCHFSPSY